MGHRSLSSAKPTLLYNECVCEKDLQRGKTSAGGHLGHCLIPTTHGHSLRFCFQRFNFLTFESGAAKVTTLWRVWFSGCFEHMGTYQISNSQTFVSSLKEMHKEMMPSKSSFGKRLKDSEAAVGHSGATALHYAASKGHVELVRLLLDRGENEKRLYKREKEEKKRHMQCVFHVCVLCYVFKQENENSEHC